MSATSAFSTLVSMLLESDHKTPKKQAGRLKPSKSTNLKSGLYIKATAPSHTYIDENSLGVDEVSPWVFTDQFSNLSLVLDAIFKKRKKKSFSDDSILKLGISGKFLENGIVFCQNFSIRSYEVGVNGTVSLETLMNHLQDTELNHLRVTGLSVDGLGSTPEMYKRKLIWVSTKTQIVVDRYPTWGDTIQADNWLVLSGKNGLRSDSVIHDKKTGDILARATCYFVMMNKETRRLCRFPNEVREEMSPFCKDVPPNLEDNRKKLNKVDEVTFENTCVGIKLRLSDLDINQHVNNAKYIGWILESVPVSNLKNHKLYSMTLEYKRECQKENVLQSVTTISSADMAHSSYHENVECNHLLKLEYGPEIVKAKTEWLPRSKDN